MAEDNDEQIENFFDSITTQEFKEIRSPKEIYSNLELIQEILAPLNEAKIFFENPSLKINKTLKNNLQIITRQKIFENLEDENLIKDIQYFQKIYEGNALETNKTIEKVKQNYIELSKSVSSLIDLFEKVKNDFFNTIKSMISPITLELKKFEKINKKKFDKNKLKIYETKRDELNKNIEIYDKNLSKIVQEIKNIYIKIKTNIENYINILNNIDGPINSMIEKIDKIFEDFEEKSKSFIEIIYDYETFEQKKEALNIFRQIKNFNSEIIKLLEQYGKDVSSKNQDLESKKKECSDDFDNIMTLNNESTEKFTKLQDETKKIINQINELLKICSLKEIKSNVPEYKGIVINQIKKNVVDGTENIIKSNQKLEVDLSKLKKFIEEKEEKIKNIITLDLAFVMDATGSMSTYLKFAQDKIISIINKISQNSNVNVRIGFIGYKDYLEGDLNYIKYPKLTDDVQNVKDFISNAKVEGGGDTCEDMVGGLQYALEYKWKGKSRFAILIADAPCHGVQYHGYPNEDKHPEGDPNYKIDEVVKNYATKNINLLCLNLNDLTKNLYNNFKKYYESGKTNNTNSDIIVEDFSMDTEKLTDMIVSKAKNFYEKRHETLID